MEGLWYSMPPDRVSVLAPRWEDAERYDAAAPFRIVRDRERFMWPGPNLRRTVHELVDTLEIETVLFGDAFPLARLGPDLAARGVPYLVMAHGFDFWLSTMPGTNSWLRHVTGAASRVPVCSAFIGKTVRTAVPAHVPVSVLTPGVDIERFRPDLPTDDIRERLGIGRRPLVVCVSRLVARKGQDVFRPSRRSVIESIPPPDQGRIWPHLGHLPRPPRLALPLSYFRFATLGPI